MVSFNQRSFQESIDNSEVETWPSLSLHKSDKANASLRKDHEVRPIQPRCEAFIFRSSQVSEEAPTATVPAYLS